jgi:hypothetical protein
MDFLSAPGELAGREGADRLSPEQPDEHVLTDAAIAAVERRALNSTGEEIAKDSESKRVAELQMTATSALAEGNCSAPRDELVATIESALIIPVKPQPDNVPEFELVPEFGAVPNFKVVPDSSAMLGLNTVSESTIAADPSAYPAKVDVARRDVVPLRDSGQQTPIEVATKPKTAKRPLIRIATRAQDPEITSERTIYSAMWESGRTESVAANGDPLTKIVEIGLRPLAVSTDTPFSVCQDGIKNLILKLDIDRISSSERETQTGRYRVYAFTEVIRRRREAGLLYFTKRPGGGRIFVTIQGEEIDLVALSERRSAVVPKIGIDALPDFGAQGPDSGNGVVPNSGAQSVPNYPPLPVKKPLDKQTKPTTTSSVDVCRIVNAFLDQEASADQFVINGLISKVLSSIPDAQTEEFETAIRVKGAETRRGRSVAIFKDKYLATAVLRYFAGEAFQERRLRAKANKFQAELDRAREAAASALEAELQSQDHTWHQLRDLLFTKMDRHKFEVWIKPLRLFRIQSGGLYLVVPTPDFRGVEETYGHLIKETASELQLAVNQVRCVTAEEAVRLTSAGTDLAGGAL